MLPAPLSQVRLNRWPMLAGAFRLLARIVLLDLAVFITRGSDVRSAHSYRVSFAQGRRVELGVAQSRIPLFPKPTNSASLRNGALHSVPSQRLIGEREGARFVPYRVLTLQVAQQTHGAEDRKRADAVTAADISLTAGA
jgi:hypothetical protein